MKLFAYFTIGFFIFLALWVTIIRPWARKQLFLAGFFAVIEPVEYWLWSKSESILFARALSFFGAVYEMLVQVSAIDVTPYLVFLPEDIRGYVSFAVTAIPMVVMVLGFVLERLRRDTTKPLELVAVKASDPVEVHETVAQTDATNANAVATVQAIKEAA